MSTECISIDSRGINAASNVPSSAVLTITKSGGARERDGNSRHSTHAPADFINGVSGCCVPCFPYCHTTARRSSSNRVRQATGG